MMASNCSGGNPSMFLRANCRASSHSPLCPCSEPQQSCSGGVTTSQPLRASTSTVSRFTSLNIRSWAHPVRTATRYRFGPAGGVTGEIISAENCACIGGVIASSSRRRWGNSFRKPLRRTKVCRPSSWYNRKARPASCRRAKSMNSQRSVTPRIQLRAGDFNTPLRSASARARSNNSA